MAFEKEMLELEVCFVALFGISNRIAIFDSIGYFFDNLTTIS